MNLHRGSGEGVEKPVEWDEIVLLYRKNKRLDQKLTFPDSPENQVLKMILAGKEIKIGIDPKK
uniref:Uncharacterized protein n=1 Tax=Leptospirillum sp. Group II '5-way CG' TaxID=419541 RepID=B6ARA3_9BACT|nr:MAG: Hypothetical protein CGL2_08982001 [Leptospirillum sp. Group II '5-way CG']